MRVLLHSNGDPFRLSGGYCIQYRKLISMFTESGHTVDCIICGSKAMIHHSPLEPYNYLKFIELSKKTHLPEFPPREQDALETTNYFVHSSVVTPLSLVNQIIQQQSSDLYLFLGEVVILNPGDEFNGIATLSATIWPCHYDPIDPGSIPILKLFDIIFPLAPSSVPLLERVFPTKTICYCPHVVEVKTSSTNLEIIRAQFNLPKDQFVWLVNAGHYETVNRKSFDKILLAFQKSLEIMPESFLFINNAYLTQSRHQVEFMIPNTYKPGDPVMVNHPVSGQQVNIGEGGETFINGHTYQREVSVDHYVRRSTPLYNLKQLAIKIGIPEDKLHENNIILSESDLSDLYRACDVLVSPSKSEGFGIPILEAQLVGLPVVTTKFLAMRDFTWYGISVPPLQREVNPIQAGVWVVPDIDGIVRAVTEIREWNRDVNYSRPKQIMAQQIIQSTMNFEAVRNILLDTVYQKALNHNKNINSSDQIIQNLISLRNQSNVDSIESVLKLVSSFFKPASVGIYAKPSKVEGLVESLVNPNLSTVVIGNGNIVPNLPENHPNIKFVRAAGDTPTPMQLVYISRDYFHQVEHPSFKLILLSQFTQSSTYFVVDMGHSDIVHRLHEWEDNDVLETIIKYNGLWFFNFRYPTADDTFKRIKGKYTLNINKAYVIDYHSNTEESSNTESDNKPSITGIETEIFQGISKDDLAKMDNCLEEMVVEGSLVSGHTIKSLAEIQRFLTHRTLWDYINNSDESEVLIVERDYLKNLKLPKIYPKRDLILLDDFSLRAYIVTKTTTELWSNKNRPIRHSLESQLRSMNYCGVYYQLLTPLTTTVPLVSEIPNHATDEIVTLEITKKNNTNEGNPRSESESDVELGELDDSYNSSEDGLFPTIDLDTSPIPVALPVDDVNSHLSDKTYVEYTECNSVDPNQIALITLCEGNQYQTAVKLAIDSKREYCERHGYTFICEGRSSQSDTANDLSVSWGKFELVQKYLPTYQFIFYSDADVMIMNDSIKIEEIISGHMSKEADLLISRDVIQYKIDPDISENLYHMLNTGNFFIRSTEWSDKLLYTLLTTDLLHGHDLAEQYALNRLFYNIGIPDSLQEFVGTIINKTSLVHNQTLFNATFAIPGVPPDTFYQPGNFLIHFMGWRDPVKLLIFMETVHSKKDNLVKLNYSYPKLKIWAQREKRLYLQETGRCIYQNKLAEWFINHEMNIVIVKSPDTSYESPTQIKIGPIMEQPTPTLNNLCYQVTSTPRSPSPVTSPIPVPSPVTSPIPQSNLIGSSSSTIAIVTPIIHTSYLTSLHHNLQTTKEYCQRHGYSFYPELIPGDNPFTLVQKHLANHEWVALFIPTGLVRNANLSLDHFSQGFSEQIEWICSTNSESIEVYITDESILKTVPPLETEYCLVKNTPANHKLLETLVDHSDPFGFLTDEYYNYESFRDRVGLLDDTRLLATSVCTLDNHHMYHPGNFLIDFREWSLASQGWLQQTYLK